ncbi:MAG: aldo/keto reductase [Halolamina sp.]|uniref:aldo/keto reductase n=1 Tax=Halolamina sp. TaxID=1940283 RepID=UPI002FC2A24E
MREIPRLGIGTYQNDDPEQCAESVRTALEMGYRHVDTAQGYENENAVGTGIAASSVDREDVSLASKITTSMLAYEDAIHSTYESAEKLGVDTIDLLYVHWPINTYDPEDTIQALNDLHADGIIREVGLSNFRVDQLEAAMARLDTELVAHQVECHPMLPQTELREHAVENGYWLVAYCPIARNQVTEVEAIREVAEKHDASPAQVSLAWLLSKENVVAIPKATSEGHIRDNWEAQQLELDDEDIAAIDAIDERRRLVDFDDAPWNQG